MALLAMVIDLLCIKLIQKQDKEIQIARLQTLEYQNSHLCCFNSETIGRKHQNPTQTLASERRQQKPPSLSVSVGST